MYEPLVNLRRGFLQVASFFFLPGRRFFRFTKRGFLLVRDVTCKIALSMMKNLKSATCHCSAVWMLNFSLECDRVQIERSWIGCEGQPKRT